jgi:hypothetical protein
MILQAIQENEKTIGAILLAIVFFMIGLLVGHFLF